MFTRIKLFLALALPQIFFSSCANGYEYIFLLMYTNRFSLDQGDSIKCITIC